MKLEDFIFDRLGDMADPDAFEIRSDKVFVARVGLVYVPTDALQDEWENATRGTKFEKIKLYIFQ